ncbi:hypothetical protein DFH09DRAFT_1082524 [Mycena vulgaris]|nr:hypothetical protein DFH09DRAFT_1082524 [Mycena vulgaris]
MAQARAGQARIAGSGSGLRFFKPKPDEAKPKPWFPGQAKPANHYSLHRGHLVRRLQAARPSATALFDCASRSEPTPLLLRPPPPAKAKAIKTDAMAGEPPKDIEMADELEIFLDSAKSYRPAARDQRGAGRRLVRANHKDEFIKLLNASPDKCVTVVILASDFYDHGRGPGAITATLMARKIPDGDKINVYPATPREQVPASNGLSMPWTNIISECSVAFKAAVLADPVFHNVHQALPISFYCFDVEPERPWIIAVYVGLSDLTTPVEFKQAVLTKLLADIAVV